MTQHRGFDAECFPGGSTIWVQLVTVSMCSIHLFSNINLVYIGNRSAHRGPFKKNVSPNGLLSLQSWSNKSFSADPGSLKEPETVMSMLPTTGTRVRERNKRPWGTMRCYVKHSIIYRGWRTRAWVTFVYGPIKSMHACSDQIYPRELARCPQTERGLRIPRIWVKFIHVGFYLLDC